LNLKSFVFNRHDVVNCNLKEKTDWLLAKNPNGKVPTIEFSDGKVLYESLVVSDFLDETHNNSRSLNASDPFQRALDRIWIEEFSKVIASKHP
jgi:glutathione S-transferase